jgi:hypothetical protein
VLATRGRAASRATIAIARAQVPLCGAGFVVASCRPRQVGLEVPTVAALRAAVSVSRSARARQTRAWHDETCFTPGVLRLSSSTPTSRATATKPAERAPQSTLLRLGTAGLALARVGASVVPSATPVSLREPPPRSWTSYRERARCRALVTPSGAGRASGREARRPEAPPENFIPGREHPRSIHAVVENAIAPHYVRPSVNPTWARPSVNPTWVRPSVNPKNGCSGWRSRTRRKSG